MKFKGTLIGAGLGIAAVFIAATSVAAAATLFGGASNQDGAVELVSDSTTPFSGIAFDDANGLTFADLTEIATDYNITDDDCRAGSPRFQVNLDSTGDGDSDGNVFVHIGPSPNFTGCAPGWQSTGNLIGNEDVGRYDTSQFVPGTQVNTYSGALALVGTYEVVGIQLVVDSGFAFEDGEQTILVDNVAINGQVYTFTGPPEDKDACKDGGWATFDTPREFKNQGDCIQFVNTGK